MPRVASRTEENLLRRYGFGRIAGVDEVGTGCLAGPVAAGAVVLDPSRHIPGLCDSKLISADERERLYDLIVVRAASWCVELVGPGEIDAINIRQAAFVAMRQAIHGLTPLPDCVIVDGFRIPNLLFPQRAFVRGDKRCAAIAAASILAKVTRDRVMMTLDAADPRYGFGRHKGYATAEHLAAVGKYGYSTVHRRSFRPPSLFDTMDEPTQTIDDDLVDRHDAGRADGEESLRTGQAVIRQDGRLAERGKADSRSSEAAQTLRACGSDTPPR